jgi:hypothetical protein
MPERCHHLHSHQCIGEPLERPGSVPHRGLTQPHGNPLRVRLAVALGKWGGLACLPVQGPCNAFRDETCADMRDRLHPAVERLGDLAIQPSWPRGIRLEQDWSTAQLRR